MFDLPDWTFEFHGHRCPFMPIGFRMGTLAMQFPGIEGVHHFHLWRVAEQDVHFEGHVTVVEQLVSHTADLRMSAVASSWVTRSPSAVMYFESWD